MEKLTEKQKEILTSLENEFARINAVDEAEVDIIKFIETSVDNKRKFRSEMEVVTKVTVDMFVQEKEKIVAYLRPIADKFGFVFQVTELYSGDGLHLLEYFRFTIFFTNDEQRKKYTNYYQLEIDRIEGYMELVYNCEDGVRFAKELNINYEKKYRGDTSNKEEFLKYFVDEVIKVLKKRV